MPAMCVVNFSFTMLSACVALLMMVRYLVALAVNVPVSLSLGVRLHLAPCCARSEESDSDSSLNIRSLSEQICFHGARSKWSPVSRSVFLCKRSGSSFTSFSNMGT